MKIITFLTFVLFACSALIVNAQDYITVYKDCDYRGASQRLYEGQYGFRELGIGNDQISSIKIPRGMKVTVYQDDNFRGGSKILQGDVSCLTEVKPGDWNDHISSMRVERVYSNTARSKKSNNQSSNTYNNGVTLYDDSNFRGADHHYSATGSWNMKDAFPNDRISSIRVSPGLQITVYTDDRQQGYSRTFTSDVSSLDYRLNDKISSITIERVNNSSGGSKKPISNKKGGSNMAVLFTDCDYRGRSMELGQGAYGANSLRGIGNDQLSSLRLPSGWEAVLFKDDNFKGESWTVTRDYGCLPYAFNDKVSSIIIRQRQN